MNTRDNEIKITEYLLVIPKFHCGIFRLNTSGNWWYNIKSKHTFQPKSGKVKKTLFA